MQRLISSAAFLGLGVLIAGCESANDHSQGTRQEGNYSTQQAKEPYSPIPGDTTGGGLRVDHRTGAEIAPGSTTGDEKIRDQDRLRNNTGGQTDNEGNYIKNPPSGTSGSPSVPPTPPGNNDTSR